MVEILIEFWFLVLGSAIAILITGLMIVTTICVIWCVVTIIDIVKKLAAGCRTDPKDL